MGLDMYFYKETMPNEIYYFRKNYELHDLMAKIWLEENPSKNYADFNCNVLHITERIINLIEECDYENYKFSIPELEGCISYKCDRDMIKKELVPILRNELSHGNKVYYTPWW